MDSSEIKNTLERLCEPFPDHLVKFLPKGGKKFAHADPRAYSDRLNEVLGVDGWTAEYTVYGPVAFNMAPQDKESLKAIKRIGKVVVVCDLTIHGIGKHSGTGEAFLDDDNAATVAEAQAFKRACARFGLGRYLYALESGQKSPKKESPAQQANANESVKKTKFKPVEGTFQARLAACEKYLFGGSSNHLLKYFIFALPEPKAIEVQLEESGAFSPALFKKALVTLGREGSLKRIDRVEHALVSNSHQTDKLIAKIDETVGKMKWS